jgi:hypothetical protein
MQTVRTYMRIEIECKNIQCIKNHCVFVCSNEICELLYTEITTSLNSLYLCFKLNEPVISAWFQFVDLIVLYHESV